MLGGFYCRAGVNHVNTLTGSRSNDAPERERHASQIWKFSIGGVVLLLGAALTPVWMGLLGWLGYELALAATSLHG
jgi:hypothetical protein